VVGKRSGLEDSRFGSNGSQQVDHGQEEKLSGSLLAGLNVDMKEPVKQGRKRGILHQANSTKSAKKWPSTLKEELLKISWEIQGIEGGGWCRDEY